MTLLNLFYENFESYAAMLAEVRGGKILRLGKSFASYSGIPYEDENYALFDENAALSDIEAVQAFFEKCGTDFSVPLMHDAKNLLQGAGLVHSAEFTAMYLTQDKMFGELSSCASLAVIDDANAHRWGAAVWRGFGGEPLTQEEKSAADFYASLALHPNNRAFALSLHGTFAATALIHRSQNVNGLYYFSALPDKRRRGCATALMDCVTARLYAEALPLVLLATEEGLPFYLHYGFSSLRTVPMYSSEVQ